MKYNIDKFISECEQLNISLSDVQIDQFLRYYEFLVETNRVMNLTAITEFEEVLVKHFLDSLSCSRVIHLNDISSVMDIGTGAGFPGIPLKIAYPHLNICLLDSLNKRVQFLNETIERLSLKGICAVHGRAEDLAGKKEYREAHDLVVSRAVANLSTLSEYCLPFARVGGFFVSYKSGNIQEELENAKFAVKTLGGSIENVELFTLSGVSDEKLDRSLVIIKKVESTKKKYPRKAGTPQRDPLRKDG